MKKQFLAKLLALAMVLSMVPVTILAANATAGTTNGDTNTGATNSGGDYYVDTTVRVDEPIAADGEVDVKVVNGTASVVLTDNAVESMTDLVKDGEIVLEIKDEGASKLNVSFPAKAMTEVAKETGATVTIKSSVATISIPNEVLSAELGTSGTVRISAQSTETSVSFSIQVSGRALKGVKGISVTF